MDFKRMIGNLMALLTVLVIGTGSASLAGIGTEEMPNSLKNKR